MINYYGFASVRRHKLSNLLGSLEVGESITFPMGLKAPTVRETNKRESRYEITNEGDQGVFHITRLEDQPDQYGVKQTATSKTHAIRDYSNYKSIAGDDLRRVIDSLSVKETIILPMAANDQLRRMLNNREAKYGLRYKRYRDKAHGIIYVQRLED